MNWFVILSLSLLIVYGYKAQKDLQKRIDRIKAYIPRPLYYGYFDWNFYLHFDTYAYMYNSNPTLWSTLITLIDDLLYYTNDTVNMDLNITMNKVAQIKDIVREYYLNVGKEDHDAVQSAELALLELLAPYEARETMQNTISGRVMQMSMI